jgi:HlyD family secretion protein
MVSKTLGELLKKQNVNDYPILSTNYLTYTIARRLIFLSLRGIKFFVIARSAATWQSYKLAVLDCHVAALLAMTGGCELVLLAMMGGECSSCNDRHRKTARNVKKGNHMKKLLAASALSVPLLVSCSNSNNDVVQGYIEGDYTYIASAESGNVNDLLVARGDAVELGDTLVTLDNQPQGDQLAQAQAQLASSQATLHDMTLGERPEEIEQIQANVEAMQAATIYYKSEAERYQNLSTQDYATKSDYDEAIYQYGVSSAKLKGYEAQLALSYQGQREGQVEAQEEMVQANVANVAIAQWGEAQKTLVSPVSGIVNDTYYVNGEWVNAGQAIASVLSPENVYIVFFLSQEIIGGVKVGDEVSFQCDGCKNPAQATINYIANQVEYTPPVIYSEDMRDKLVFEVQASTAKKKALDFHPGQPVDVSLSGKFS